MTTADRRIPKTPIKRRGKGKIVSYRFLPGYLGPGQHKNFLNCNQLVVWLLE